MSPTRSTAPEGRTIDLDAVRKARAEADGATPPPVVRLGGKDFPLPPALPALVVVGLGRAHAGDFTGFDDVIVGLFGEASAPEVLKLGLELDDFDVILEQAYGDGMGEASGSAT